MLYYGESPRQWRYRQPRLSHIPTVLHNQRSPSPSSPINPRPSIPKTETRILVPSHEHFSPDLVHRRNIEITDGTKIAGPIADGTTAQATAQTTAYTTAQTTSQTTSQTTATELTEATPNTVEPPLVLPLPSLSLLSPERLMDLSCLASEMDLGAYSTTSPAFNSWLRKYPEILAEGSQLARRLEIRLPSTTRPHSLKSYAKMFIKAMPTPYHDAIGQNMISQTLFSVRTAVGCDPRAIGLRVGNSEFRGFGGHVYDGRLSRFAAKIPDLALLPNGKEFPTVATEVGFTESWQHLLEDAQLWLYGTYGTTMSVLLFVLHEGRYIPSFVTSTSIG